MLKLLMKFKTLEFIKNNSLFSGKMRGWKKTLCIVYRAPHESTNYSSTLKRQ